MDTEPTFWQTGPRPRTREMIMTDYPYIILYRVQVDEIVVLRIYHSRQQR